MRTICLSACVILAIPLLAHSQERRPKYAKCKRGEVLVFRGQEPLPKEKILEKLRRGQQTLEIRAAGRAIFALAQAVVIHRFAPVTAREIVKGARQVIGHDPEISECPRATLLTLLGDPSHLEALVSRWIGSDRP